MESEMKTAWMMAGIKLALGLVFVGVVIGIRIISVTPNRAEAEIESLERAQPDAKAWTSRVVREATAPGAVSGQEASRMDRPRSGGRENLRDAVPGSRDGDLMVSCRLVGRTQFMTGDDCAMRGGRSTLFETER